MLEILLSCRWYRIKIYCSKKFSTAFFLILLASSARAEPLNLDEFIGGIENGCILSAPLSNFRAEINARYSYEEGVERLRTKVNLPPAIKAAIGLARATRHSGYTNVEVSLRGFYKGLPTRSISFDLGHSNGINVTTLTFDVPVQKVIEVIGPAVARTMQKFNSDSADGSFEFSAKIIPQREYSALVCDTST